MRSEYYLHPLRWRNANKHAVGLNNFPLGRPPHLQHQSRSFGGICIAAESSCGIIFDPPGSVPTSFSTLLVRLWRWNQFKNPMILRGDSEPTTVVITRGGVTYCRACICPLLWNQTTDLSIRNQFALHRKLLLTQKVRGTFFFGVP